MERREQGDGGDRRKGCSHANTVPGRHGCEQREDRAPQSCEREVRVLPGLTPAHRSVCAGVTHYQRFRGALNVSDTTMTNPAIRNGVDTATLFATIDAIKGDP